MADNRPIGIFDSGLGGLTVVREIIRHLPNENIVYFGDTGRVPYGTKSRSTIRKYAVEDEEFLLSKNVKAIIAACGTVSAVAADTGYGLPVPFFEVISHAAAAAAAATKTKRIGVIGTPVTINSASHEKQILKILPDAKVFTNSCPLFVPLVEEGLFSSDDPVVYETAKRYLACFENTGIDTLVLGCTHYPILQDVISKILGKDVKLINMGDATALAVKRFFESQDKLNDGKKNAVHSFFVSDMTNSFENVAQLLLGEKLDSSNARQVDIGKI